jgi:hypothetical protein
MKIKTFAAGLIITLIGICMMSSYHLPSNYVRESSIAYNTNSWDINATLTAGDNVILLFRENALWVTHQPYGFIDSDDIPPKMLLPIYIDITPIDPPGNTTEWEQDLAIFKAPAAGGGYLAPQLVGYTIAKTNLTDTPIDTSVWLDSKGNLTEVGGIVPFTGLYRAELLCYFENETPSFMGFYHNVTITGYPYINLLPAGGAVMIFGGTVSFLAARGLPVHRSNRKSRIKTRMNK